VQRRCRGEIVAAVAEKDHPRGHISTCFRSLLAVQIGLISGVEFGDPGDLNFRADQLI
jgi:hypothetical protein